jgi:hypothetical protein
LNVASGASRGVSVRFVGALWALLAAAFTAVALIDDPRGDFHDPSTGLVWQGAAVLYVGWFFAGWIVSCVILLTVKLISRHRGPGLARMTGEGGGSMPATERRRWLGKGGRATLVALMLLWLSLAVFASCAAVDHNPQGEFWDIETGAIHFNAVLVIFGSWMAAGFGGTLAVFALIAVVLRGADWLDDKLGTR